LKGDVDAFAEAVGMSRRQLQRKLKAVADQTPSAFVRRIRLGRGAQLLAQDYGTVSEIAYEVGFGSPSYFTKCFRETFGTTPSRYEPEEE
jgi:AraC-like DNA-binding protein